jgi:hypothetical protein
VRHVNPESPATSDVLPTLREAGSISKDRAPIVDIALIVGLWFFSSMVVNPVGNFPLMDDWAYGTTVKHLLETGDYRPLAWTPAPIITNVLWGALFCLPGGFSFTSLRLSTLCASMFGLIGSYTLVRNLQQPRWLAVLATLTLGFSPIYYVESQSFMTDVPFTAAVIWATVFLARSLKSGSEFQMGAGTVLALTATLSRELALCIPLAFGVASLLKSGFTLRAARRSLAPFAVCSIAFLAFSQWLAASGRRPTLVDAKARELLESFTSGPHLVRLLLGNGFIALDYLGLFLIPVLLSLSGDLLRPQRKITWALTIVGIAIFSLGGAVHTFYGDWSGNTALTIPVLGTGVGTGNIFTQYGVGVLFLRDMFLLRLNNIPPFPLGFWITVSVLALAGVTLLVFAVSVRLVDLLGKRLRGTQISGEEAISIFFLICWSTYLFAIISLSYLVDRYLIPLLYLLPVWLIATSGRPIEFSLGNRVGFRTAGFALLAVFSLFAIGTTRDYLVWSRMRWEALQDLVQKGHISPTEIDGGLEFNALYLYDPNYLIKFDPKYQRDPGRSFWWVHRDTYQIAFGPVRGYKQIREYTYYHWLPPHVQKLLVLRKE